MKSLIFIFGVLACTLTVGCQGRDSSVVAAADSIVAESKPQQSGEPVAKERPVVVAYYFHRTFRCAACLAIEGRAAESIERHFAQELADGRLVWMPFNLDEPGGDAYEKDFELSLNSLVLSKTLDGQSIRHSRLDRVWNLAGDAVQFDGYMKNEVERFLNE
jgi:hypothetical protein